MNKEKSCGAVIYNNKKFLIVRHQKGHWSFPKGHVEKEETETQTALREIKEETNLTVILDTDFRHHTLYEPKPNITKEVIYFLGLNPKGKVKIQPEEIKDYKWVTYKEALNIITYENDKEILKKIKEYIINKNKG